MGFLTVVDTYKLSVSERMDLARHEEIIERGLNTFVDVGLALLAIRDGKLYRMQYGTFEDYCRERWGIEKSQTYRLMDSAMVVRNLRTSPIGEVLPANESQARPLTSLTPDEQPIVWKRAVETAPDGKVTAAHVQSVVDEYQNKPRPEVVHVSDDSYEWYTPQEYIEAARGVMGGIDLDPASCEAAQRTVQAGHYYSKEIDGLAQEWQGKVWLNPPYNMPLVEQFTGKAITEYEAGNIESAIVLVNNCTDTEWFHALLDKYPVCLTRGRVRFWSADGPNLGARQGQAIFYLGDNPTLFTKVFSTFGIVVVRYDD